MTVIQFLTGDVLTPEVWRQMDEACAGPFARGTSWGLQYPWVSSDEGCCAVWCRYCGKIIAISPPVTDCPWEGMSRVRVDKMCRKANGLERIDSRAELLAMDAQE